MKYNPEKHHRRSIRLKGYDYTQPGWYFITICVQNRECLLGTIRNGEMILNDYGKIVEFTWFDLPNHNAHVILDQFGIMPNHVHGIIVLDDIHVGAGSVGAGSVGAGSEPAPTPGSIPTDAPAATDADPPTDTPAATVPRPPIIRHGLPEIVRQFKTFSARRINQKRQTPGVSVWQRNYYEHIIRNETDLQRIREYIQTNPARWREDSLFTETPEGE